MRAFVAMCVAAALCGFVAAPALGETIRLEAEDYMVGGEGVGFHDNDVGNNGSQYRTAAGDDVDIETCSAGGYNVGWTNGGEWLRMTTDPGTWTTDPTFAGGDYYVVYHTASPSGGGPIGVEVDGTRMDSVSAPATGGWQNWTTVTSGSSVPVAAGSRQVRFMEDGSGFNLNYLEFRSRTTPAGATSNDFDIATQGSQTAYTITNVSGPPAQIQDVGDDFLRVLYQTGGEQKFVGFDRTEVGTGFSRVQADWDFRAVKTSDPAGSWGDQTFADGYAFALLNTADYGATGAAPTGDGDPENGWVLNNSLTVAFDGYEGYGPEQYDGKKDILMHHNGTQVGFVNSAVDFTHGYPGADPNTLPYDHAQVLVTFLPGTNLAKVDVYLGGTEAEASGTRVLEAFIPASAYENRAAFGARTGGAWHYFDLDNVKVQYSTEALGPLPPGMTGEDINTSGGTSGTLPSGEIVVEGDGSDIWGSSDQFRYVYRTQSGDFKALARLVSQENTNDWAKAGIMAREDTSAGSRHVHTSATPSNGVTQQWRDSTGGGSEWPEASIPGSPNSDAAPMWLSLERRGNLYASSWAPDVNGRPGAWGPKQVHYNGLPDDLLVGLNVTSHAGGTQSTVVFDDVDLDAASLGGVSAPRMAGPYGPGGSWVAYQRLGHATFDEGRAFAQTESFAGRQGHLATVNTGRENNFIFRNVSLGWIGLTDLTTTSGIDSFNYTALGTAEGGNTSGQPVPVAVVPVAGQRGYGYTWVNGAAFTRGWWNNGEPNDAGGAEDAIEMVQTDTQGRYGGLYNDLPAGGTVGQANNYRREGTIEYNLNIFDPSKLIAPGFFVTVAKATDGGIGDDPWGMRDADSLIRSTGDPGRIIGSGPVALADFHNSGGSGNFGTNLAFPGVTGDTDNAVLGVKGTLNVQTAGVYQFRATGDDGAYLRINGQNVIIDDDMHGVENVDSPAVYLPAGTYQFEWVQYEGGGGWTAELAYRQGTGAWVLVGDASQGIAANMVATTYKLSGNVDITNVAQARQLLAGQLHRENGTPLHGYSSVIDFRDPDGGSGPGNFPYDFSFLGVSGDDYVLKAETMVWIPSAGQWTFGVDSDDGFWMQILGGDLLSVTNDSGSVLGMDGQLAFDGLRGPGTTLGVFDFAGAGYYPLELIYLERGGGAEVELFAAPGAFQSFDANAFRLVGDVEGGGLRTMINVPEPATVALLAFAAAGIGGYVRRRRKA